MVCNVDLWGLPSKWVWGHARCLWPITVGVAHGTVPMHQICSLFGRESLRFVDAFTRTTYW